MFLHEVTQGAADRSYGIHVADLAGIPKEVVRRAQTLLDELEAGRARKPVQSRQQPGQLRFIEESNLALDAIRNLNVERMTPIEAITKLYEVKRLADP